MFLWEKFQEFGFFHNYNYKLNTSTYKLKEKKIGICQNKKKKVFTKHDILLLSLPLNSPFECRNIKHEQESNRKQQTLRSKKVKILIYKSTIISNTKDIKLDKLNLFNFGMVNVTLF